MPKQKEVDESDLKAVLDDAPDDTELDSEENESDFLASFEDDDDGFEKPELDPVPADGSGEAGEGGTDDKDGTDPAKAGDDDGKAGDGDKGDEPVVEPLSELQELENRLATRMRNVEGHIGGLKSQLQRAFEAKKEGVQDTVAPTNAQIQDAAGRKGSTEKLDALRTEFPEWADALTELEENLAAPQAASTAPQGETFTREEVANLVTAEQNRLREIFKVDTAHPGWEETRNTPEFAHWRDSQPETVQVLADSSVAADAIKMLDLYKEATKPAAPANPETKEKSKERLKRSVVPQTTGAAPVQHVPTEEEDFLAAFKD